MIVDSSAIVAVILSEPGWEQLDAKLTADPAVKISAATYVETCIVVDSRNNAGSSRRLDSLLEAWKVDLVDVSAEHAARARQAYRDYGKGSGHPAQLNYGDTFSYALASATGEPLLFVGEDFTHTDLVAA